MKTTLLNLILILNGCMGIAQINTFPTSGNVGIGTNTPAASLDVKGRVTIDSSVTIRDSTVIEKQLRVEQDVKIIGESVFVGDAKAKNDLKILGTTKMKGDAWVEGDFKLKGLADSTVFTSEFLTINPNGKVTRGGFLIDLADASYITGCKNDMPRWANNGSGILFTGVLPNCPASVGINTNTPVQAFHVVGKGYFSEGIGIGLGATNPYVALQVNGNSLFSGNVGIGVDTFGTGYVGNLALDVQGDGRFYNHNNPLNYISLGYNTANAIIDMSGDGRLLINYYSGKDVVIGRADHENGPSQLTVTGKLSVGGGFINSNSMVEIHSSPSNQYAIRISDSNFDDVFRVDAQGKIICTEAWVRLKHNFPDYVFKNEYSLISLEELEKFINTYHRLPNMPTADEIHQHGADLGELNRLLVEKVEELTLYTIQLKKELEELKAGLDK